MFLIVTEKCLQCGICTDSCPIGAIRNRGLGFYIDPLECTGCRICLSSCPLEAIQAQPKQTP